ncbi:MAG: ABC transporter ATP-binding protein [Chitinophagaceae bacterium]|nr:ABC transporter ATP-binding protein [Chitinophagaceae bacterium]
MNHNLLKVSHLTKQFGEIKAVDDLSFSMDKGFIYGFLGQNGAGKSTTIRMLLDLIRPDEGSIEIFGMELKKHRNEIMRQVGAIIERPDLYKYLSAWEHLKMFATMSGIKYKRAQLMEQLALVGLAERAHSKVKTYSQGMKQRLGIAIALVHDPALVILDEPTNGLDPQGIADMRNLILSLCHEKGKTVLVSSHLLSEVELIADSMLIIDRGRKLVEGKVNELFDPSEHLCELITSDNATAIEKIRSSALGVYLKEEREEAILLKAPKEQVPLLVKQLVEMDIPVLSLHTRHSLEDYFLSLTTKRDAASSVKN